MLYKPVLHWMYGLGIYLDSYYGLVMILAQLVYLCFLWILTAIFTWLVWRYKFHAPSPTAYGHLQTKVDVVDNRTMNMHWVYVSKQCY
ncbi:uncharacterized protein V1518DRAFT_419728 [Limtongia smithiae]|uniref:uncharacterized protein n=1 Tax=Limtongia smithiae TaxID=1125753 RepID=UPI0034CFA8DD